MARKNHKAKPAKKNVKGKASLMAAIGNPILKNKKMKISSRTPDSNYD